ncbi:hypothetical protein D3C86_1709240 [compost metagenome]
MRYAQQFADGAANLGLLWRGVGAEAERIAEDEQRDFAFFRQQTVVGAVVVHAVVGGHQYLIASVEPALQVVGEVDVGEACAVAVLRGVEAVLVPGVVDVHRVDQQEIRRMAQAQVFGVGEQVRIRVVIGPVEMPVLDR